MAWRMKGGACAALYFYNVVLRNNALRVLYLNSGFATWLPHLKMLEIKQAFGPKERSEK